LMGGWYVRIAPVLLLVSRKLDKTTSAGHH
jgi:hypothetical protein